MPKKQQRREHKRPEGWRSTRLEIAIGVLALLSASLWWLHFVEPVTDDAPQVIAELIQPGSSQPTETLTDEGLQAAADQLLALINPERPENEYFSDFARDRLRWVVRENRAGRLDVAFLTDASNGPLPSDVWMAAWKLGDKPTVFITKPGFMKFLIEGGATAPPFTPQHKNDFALALVHEIVHLLNPDADPRNPNLRAAEESRVWREVNLNVVRPLRERNQPMHHRFRDVDDALRVCRDELPCPGHARLVRLGL